MKAVSAREETAESVADTAALAQPEPGPDGLAPVLDEEILEPSGCIR